MVAFGVPAADGTPFVQKLWDMSTPTGQYRYYDGMLYLLSYLHASGRFHLWF
jgi:oligosaccharide reducing-end xylanase